MISCSQLLLDMIRKFKKGHVSDGRITRPALVDQSQTIGLIDLENVKVCTIKSFFDCKAYNSQPIAFPQQSSVQHAISQARPFILFLYIDTPMEPSDF
jgi:hypothetical protein